jgi:hypothetical protein
MEVKQFILKKVYSSGGITLKDLSDIIYPKIEIHEVVRDMVREEKLVEIEYSVPGDFRVHSLLLPLGTSVSVSNAAVPKTKRNREGEDHSHSVD